ncbi:MAG: protein BatD [Chitinophagaceae bacterium]|nr:MAG: protein BatD [Chitinophagaceae bacterium]
MKPAVFRIYISFFFMLSIACVQAQPKFTASFTPEKIGKNEVVQLRLVVENANEVQQILAPSLNQFIIVSGPNQESGMSMVNDNVSKFVAVSYMLKPRAPGNYTIAPATARVDGQLLKSNMLRLQVTHAASVNSQPSNANTFPFGVPDPFESSMPQTNYKDYVLRRGENALDKIKKNIFVRVETDKKTCYVGEPVLATYKLYTRLKSESSLNKTPSFNGFSVIDMQQPDNMNYAIEKLNGRDYNVYIIRKAQLYPLQSGSLELTPAEIDNNIHFIKEGYANHAANSVDDIFRDFNDASIPAEGIEDHRVILKSDPLMIQVKPLPEAGRPADYKAAVGKFEVAAVLARNNFSTDDAGHLVVTISGQGNLPMITSIDIGWPTGIEGFEPKVTDDFSKLTVPVSGRKLMDFPFTVAAPGTYTIPAIAFSYFDPAEGRYKTAYSDPIQFTVNRGTGRTAPITNKTSGQDSFLNSLFSNRLRVVSLVAILIICGLIFWLRQESRADKRQREKEAAAVQIPQETEEEPKPQSQENPLALASSSMAENNPAKFYQDLNESLKKFLAHQLQILPEELNRKNISEKLDGKGIPNGIILQLQALMDEIEWKLYTPASGHEAMQELYQRTHEMIQLLAAYKI